MPDATTTPVDPAAAPAIREEITQRTDALRLALQHLTDQVTLAVSEGRKTQQAVATATAEVDHRIDKLELRIGKALKERDSIDEEITGTVKLTIERVETLAKDHEETKTRLGRVVAWIDDNKGKIGLGVGGTGLGIAVASAAPHVGGWIRSLLEIFK